MEIKLPDPLRTHDHWVVMMACVRCKCKSSLCSSSKQKIISCKLALRFSQVVSRMTSWSRSIIRQYSKSPSSKLVMSFDFRSSTMRCKTLVCSCCMFKVDSFEFEIVFRVFFAKCTNVGLVATNLNLRPTTFSQKQDGEDSHPTPL
jgi:hypothetical protein